MRGPIAKVREQAFLAIRFGAELQDLLFPQEIDGQARSDSVGESLARGFVQIAWNIREEKGVAGFVEFDQLFFLCRVEGRVSVLQVIDLPFEQRIFGKQVYDAKWHTADGNDVYATVIVALRGFQNFGGAANADDTLFQSQEHAERNVLIEALAYHAAVARFENVQRKLLAGEKNDVQRKKRNSV